VAAPWTVWANLAVVYLVWGSTYLAIRVVVETMPPLISSGVRFFFAGAVLYAVLAARRGWRAVRFSRAELVAALLVGAALVAGGNGLVMVAEQTVPSAHAALIIGSEPLWIIVLRALAREPIARGTLLGVGLGFAGVAILVVPGGQEGQGQLVGLLLLVVAAASWATGSFFSRRLALPTDPFLSTALQMMAGGLLVFLGGLAVGETRGLDVATFSAESLIGFVYLLVFGSLVAFTAYTWLLQNAPISLVSTYAYVNPVVAVVLGWAILREDITPTMLVGAALIIASVAFVVRKESRVPASDALAQTPAAAVDASTDTTGERAANRTAATAPNGPRSP
jgi:drug/metabolite transporter (DMT)-like permease